MGATTLGPAQLDIVLQVQRALQTKTRAQLFFAAWRRSEWWGSARDITTLAGLATHRRGEIELGELVTDGWLIRDEKGARNQERLVRFRLGPAAINLIAPPRSERSDRRDQFDRTAAIDLIAPPRSERSQHSTSTHVRGPAPPDPDLKTCNRPSVPEGSGEAHARTDETFRDSDLHGSDVKWVAAQWSTSGHVAHVCWTRLLGFGLTRREGREYLSAARRGSHAAFNGLDVARKPLGAACTWERVQPWIEWRRRSLVAEPAPPRRARPAREEPTALDEAEAMHELLKRELGRGGRSRA